MDRIKENLKYNLEWFRALIIITLADLSGLITLIKCWMGLPTELLLLVFGIFSIFILAILLVKVHSQITADIKKLKV